METINVPIKEVIHVHSGQYHAYGDSFSVWDIILEEGVFIGALGLIGTNWD